MARAAELIFVAGPQAGQRSPLMTNPVLAGRGGECDVRISEECVSRKAFALTLTRDGWIFENLTSRKMPVSGTACKPGKQLFLETGDVIAPGVESQLLFVEADDDAEAALAAYRASQVTEAPPEAAPEEVPSDSPAPVPVGVTPIVRPPALPETSLAIGAEVAAKVTDQALRASVQADEKAAKRRKMLVVFAVYAAAMVGVIVLLATFRKNTQTGPGAGAPHTLTKEEIEGCIRKGYQDYRVSLRREPLPLDAGKAEDCLKIARRLWATRSAAIVNPYEAYRNYKLYLAYSGLHLPKDARDVDDCDAARDHLIKWIWEVVQNVKSREDLASWKEATVELDKLERSLRGCTEDDPEYPILKNAREHDNYVRGILLTKKPSSAF
ncbi:MAG: FHA domain-containing protein [Planctomycetota bacterium]|nr:FHA domain-containing protein [Planctomycetota bacterium]